MHTPEGLPFARIAVNGHQEAHRIRTGSFTLWLQQCYWNEYKSSPGAQAVQDALSVLEGRARFQGEERPVHYRIAGSTQAGTIWLDLANPQWQALKITAAGWEVVDNPPLLFRRSGGELPLPFPERGGKIDELRALLNIADERDWRLSVGFLLGALNPEIPYPIALFVGEQGSGKSTAADMLCQVIDPIKGMRRRPPRNTEDVIIAANSRHLLLFDNISTIPGWLSDDLAAISTGAALGKRQLYADDQEVLLEARRPLALTSIEDCIRRGDLLDRTLVISLQRISNDRRMEELELWPRFREAHPRVLAGLLDAASTALARWPTVRLVSSPRMIDFAHWVVAGEPALPWQPGDFMAAYQENAQDASRIAVEADAVAGVLIEFMDGARGNQDGQTTQGRDYWQGTATALLAELDALAPERLRKSPEWPKAPNTLSNRLRRLAANLPDAGIALDFSSSHRPRLITFQRIGEKNRPQSSNRPPRHEPSTREDDPGHEGDDLHPGGDDLPGSERLCASVRDDGDEISRDDSKGTEQVETGKEVMREWVF